MPTVSFPPTEALQEIVRITDAKVRAQGGAGTQEERVDALAAATFLVVLGESLPADIKPPRAALQEIVDTVDAQIRASGGFVDDQDLRDRNGPGGPVAVRLTPLMYLTHMSR